MNSCDADLCRSRKGDISYGRVVTGGTRLSRSQHFSSIRSCPLIDEEIFWGEAGAQWHEYGQDAELEWCLIFSKPLSQLKVTRELGCRLQGTIRERVLYPTAKKRKKVMGNQGSRSIIAMGMDVDSVFVGGVETNLAAVYSGRTCAAMRLEYQKENQQGLVERTVPSSILTQVDLVSSLKKVQAGIVGRKHKDVHIIRLNAAHRHGGYLQERWLKYKSALTAVKGVHHSTIANSTIRSRLMSDVIERREYIQRGTEARLQVADGSGRCVGYSVLKVS